MGTLNELKDCLHTLRTRAGTSSTDDETDDETEIEKVVRAVFGEVAEEGVTKDQFGACLSKATHWKNPEQMKRESVVAREAAAAAKQMVEDASADDRLENNLALM